MEKIVITGKGLTIEDVVKVARSRLKVVLSDDAKKRILESRKVVERLVENGNIVYGLTTGFGSLANVTISKKQTENLQSNLIMSHSAGVGNPFSEEIVRVIMLLKVNTFANGLSGVRLDIVEMLVEMLNRAVYPFVPEKGSVGASGDLVPLSHLTLVMLGLGEAFVKGKKVEGKDALKEAGLTPIKLTSKEGIALNNGTQVMTSIAAMAVYDSIVLLKNSQIAAAATLEALKASLEAFDIKLHKARPHNGQIACAENMAKLVKGSGLINSNHKKVQDCYSVRCYPQIAGASMDAISYIKKVVETEINSVTDNPLIFENGAISGGNFHGQPIALATDFLAIAVAEIGNVAERRVARLIDPNLNEGLPPFLIKNSGLNSGFMIPQYTAASLVSENKVLAHPASVDSIPTSANQEDHVSMGTIAARKSFEIVKNVENIIAIELYTALQALEFREEKTGEAVGAVKEAVRRIVPRLDNDRVMYKDIEKIKEMLKSEEIISIAEKKVGKMASFLHWSTGQPLHKGEDL